jgi:thiol:disulfide interchange protein DsbD
MIMKNILFSFLSVFLISNASLAQSGSAKQVTWTYAAKKLADKKYEVRMTAVIQGNYHLYAQQAGVEGPVPTTISFSPNPLLTLDGKPSEQGKKITKMEEAWDGKVNFYEKTVTFVQIVNAKSKAKTSLNGKIEFMVCNDELCLPPSEVSFKIPIGG